MLRNMFVIPKILSVMCLADFKETIPPMNAKRASKETMVTVPESVTLEAIRGDLNAIPIPI